MVHFTIWSSHSPQTLLMLYRRTDEMISTAGFVTGKAKSFAVSSVPGFITLSVWDWHRNQRGTGFVLNVRLVPDEWMHCLPRLLSFLFLPLISNFSNNPNTRRREVLCLPSARSWSSPFLGTDTGSGLSTPALGKTMALNIDFDSLWVFGSLWDLQPSLILLECAFQKLQTSTSSYVSRRSRALFLLLGCCFLLHHWILGSSQAGRPVFVCPTWGPSDALLHAS